EYVRRDLGQPGGGFASAEDADSEGVEGRFYVWTVDEVRQVLGPLADPTIDWYGISEAGNFEGANILHRADGVDVRRPPEVDEARLALLARRQQRVRPGLD